MKEAMARIAVPLAVGGLLALGLFMGATMIQTTGAHSEETSHSTTIPSSEAADTSTSEIPAATHRAQVDFGSPVSDFYLRSLLEQYEVEPVAAYMTTTGFFGALRVAIPAASAEFIAQARSETISGFSSGAWGGVTTRAHDFFGEPYFARYAESRRRPETCEVSD